MSQPRAKSNTHPRSASLPREVLDAIGFDAKDTVPFAREAWTGVGHAAGSKPRRSRPASAVQHRPPSAFSGGRASVRTPPVTAGTPHVHEASRSSAPSRLRAALATSTALAANQTSISRPRQRRPHSATTASPGAVASSHGGQEGGELKKGASHHHGHSDNSSPPPLPPLEDPIEFDSAELDGIRGVDKAVIAMRNAAGRIRTMATALATSQPMHKTGVTVLEESDLTAVQDPELRRIAELQRRLELALSDNDAQRAQIGQLHADVADRDSIVVSLRREVDELTARVSELEVELEEAHEDASHNAHALHQQQHHHPQQHLLGASMGMTAGPGGGGSSTNALAASLRMGASADMRRATAAPGSGMGVAQLEPTALMEASMSPSAAMMMSGRWRPPLGSPSMQLANSQRPGSSTSQLELQGSSDGSASPQPGLRAVLSAKSFAARARRTLRSKSPNVGAAAASPRSGGDTGGGRATCDGGAAGAEVLSRALLAQLPPGLAEHEIAARLSDDLVEYLGSVAARLVAPGILRSIGEHYAILRGQRAKPTTALATAAAAAKNAGSGGVTAVRSLTASDPGDDGGAPVGADATTWTRPGALRWAFPPPSVGAAGRTGPAAHALPSIRCLAVAPSFSHDPADAHITTGNAWWTAPSQVTVVAVRIHDVERIDPEDNDARSAMRLAAQRTVKLIHTIAEQFQGLAILSQPLHKVFVFPGPIEACSFGHQVQADLLTQDWPRDLERYSETQKTFDEGSESLLWRGVRVAVGAHTSEHGSVHWWRDPAADAARFYGPGVAAAICLAGLAPYGVVALDPTCAKYLRQLGAFLDDPHCGFLEWTFNPFILAANTPTGGEAWLPGDAKKPLRVDALMPWPLAARLGEHLSLAQVSDAHSAFVDELTPPNPVEAIEFHGGTDLSMPAHPHTITVQSAAGSTRVAEIEEGLATGPLKGDSALDLSFSRGVGGGVEPTASVSSMTTTATTTTAPAKRPSRWGRVLPVPLPIAALVASCVTSGAASSCRYADEALEAFAPVAKLPHAGPAVAMLVGVADFDSVAAKAADCETAAAAFAPLHERLRHLIAKYATLSSATPTPASSAATATRTFNAGTKVSPPQQLQGLQDVNVIDAGTCRERRLLLFHDEATALQFAEELLVASIAMRFDGASGGGAGGPNRSRHHQQHAAGVAELHAALASRTHRGRVVASGRPVVVACHRMKVTPAVCLSSLSTLSLPQRLPTDGAAHIAGPELEVLRNLFAVACSYDAPVCALSEATLHRARLQPSQHGLIDAWHVDAPVPFVRHWQEHDDAPSWSVVPVFPLLPRKAACSAVDAAARQAAVAAYSTFPIKASGGNVDRAVAAARQRAMHSRAAESRGLEQQRLIAVDWWGRRFFATPLDASNRVGLNGARHPAGALVSHGGRRGGAAAIAALMDDAAALPMLHTALRRRYHPGRREDVKEAQRQEEEEAIGAAAAPGYASIQSLSTWTTSTAAVGNRRRGTGRRTEFASRVESAVMALHDDYANGIGHPSNTCPVPAQAAADGGVARDHTTADADAATGAIGGDALWAPVVASMMPLAGFEAMDLAAFASSVSHTAPTAPSSKQSHGAAGVITPALSSAQASPGLMHLGVTPTPAASPTVPAIGVSPNAGTPASTTDFGPPRSPAPFATVVEGPLDLLSVARAAQDRAVFAEAKLARTSREIRLVHHVIESVFRLLPKFLDPLWDGAAAAVAPEDCIASIVRAVRVGSRRVGEDATLRGGGSAASGTASSLLSEEWSCLLASAKHIPAAADIAAHDASELCSSALGHLAKHFLYLRALSRRVSIKEEGVLRRSASSAVAAGGGQSTSPISLLPADPPVAAVVRVRVSSNEQELPPRAPASPTMHPTADGAIPAKLASGTPRRAGPM